MPAHHGPVIADKDGLEVIRCRPCGFAHLDPIPEAVDVYYKSDFWEKDKPGALEDINASWPWWETVYGDWLTLLEGLTTGRRLLDVGCGYGFFLKVARERGWEVTGIEVSDVAREYAKDKLHLNVQERIDPGTWDVVSGLWFLEHYPNPHSFISSLRESMAFGSGLLFLMVPNELTEAQRKAERFAGGNYWAHKTHINYFDKASLAWLLGRHKFRPLEWFSTYPMESFIEMGMNYVADGALGKPAHALVECKELGQGRDLRIAESIARASMGLGRDMGVIAVA